MTRLRLWLARLLLPRGWVNIYVGGSRAIRRIGAGDPLGDGDLLIDNDGRVYAMVFTTARVMRHHPHADTLGQDDLAPPAS